MDKNLQEVCDLLDNLSDRVLNATSEDRLFSVIYNWQWPAVNRHMLASIPKNLSNRIRENYPNEVDDNLRNNFEYVVESIEYLDNQMISLMFGGNGLQAIPAFVDTLASIKSMFEPFSNWQTLMDNKALPASLARKLRSIKSELDEITPDKEDLQHRIGLIKEATETAENLPTDLASLRDARSKVDKITTDAAELYGKIDAYNKQADTLVKGLDTQSSRMVTSLEIKDKEAEKVLAKCEEAYKGSTSTGLAVAFSERANRSSWAVATWVFFLLVALGFSGWVSTERTKILLDLMNVSNPQWGIIWLNIVLSLLSVGAPIWFAWLSTKQINQRFRLSEDYAFKAAVARAYEGYRREAARIDPLLEARLFNSALTRLEEAPLRFIGDDAHGSPWQELFASKPFQQALSQIPEFKDTVIEILKEKVSGLGSITLEKVKSAITKESKPEGNID